MIKVHFSSPFEQVMFPVRFRSVTFGALQQHPGRRAAEQTATEGRNKFIPWDRKWLPPATYGPGGWWGRWMLGSRKWSEYLWRATVCEFFIYCCWRCFFLLLASWKNNSLKLVFGWFSRFVHGARMWWWAAAGQSFELGCWKWFRFIWDKVSRVIETD